METRCLHSGLVSIHTIAGEPLPAEISSPRYSCGSLGSGRAVCHARHVVQALAYDTVVWLPNALILTGLLLIATFFLWRSRGARVGLRMFGVSLLPLGLYFVGLWGLLWRVGLAVSRFISGFVLHPTVWVGLIMIAVSVLLLIVPGRIRRLARSTGTAEPTITGRTQTREVTQKRRSAQPPQDDDEDDLGDVADILKRHGID